MHTLETGDNENELNTNTKSKEENEKPQKEIRKILANHRADDPYLDLSNKALTKFPSEVFVLAHIQHLYLEANILRELPDNFFDRLPALQWLDLRNNKIKALPASIGRHQSLKNLLLEGNQITHLPLQLGLSKTLNGLSLQGNPLQHPPHHIIDQGVYVILSFLYQELQNRSRESSNVVTKEVEQLQINFDDCEDEEILTEDINVTDRKLTSPLSDDYQLLRKGLAPTSASLHRPVTYQEYKGKFQTSRLTDSFGDNKVGNNKELSLLHLRHQADDRREKLRAMRERQNAFADQRRKSRTAPQKSRNEKWKNFTPGPDLNFQSSIQGIEPAPVELHDDIHEEIVEEIFPSQNIEKTRKSSSQIKQDSFLVDFDEKDLVEYAARLQNFREKYFSPHELNSYRSLPNSVARKNEAIQRRMKQHSHKLHGRMKEMRTNENKERDSISSRELQRQLLDAKMKRQLELDYRFRAFTGDSISLKSSSQKSTST